MANADLGTKRLCPNCGARYYDLNRTPIICPRCGTQFEIPVGRARPQAAAIVKNDEEVEEVETEAAELISLEEADAEVAGDAAEEEADDGIEVGEEADEDVFLEEEEEEGDDVADIIGDVDEEER